MPTFFAVMDPSDPTNPDVLPDFVPGARTYQTPSGTTKDAAGAPLAGCTVDLFRTADNQWVGRTISGPDGSWAVGPISDPAGPFYAVAYLPGSPDRAGTTVNTLQLV